MARRYATNNAVYVRVCKSITVVWKVIGLWIILQVSTQIYPIIIIIFLFLDLNDKINYKKIRKYDAHVTPFRVVLLSLQLSNEGRCGLLLKIYCYIQSFHFSYIFYYYRR